MQAAWPERSVGNPLFDRLPWWFDGLHGLIRPPRRRAHPAGFGFASVQNAYKPSAFFDFLPPEDGADGFHGALAARAFQGVASPDFEDEVAPERAHVPGSTFGRGGDEEDLGGMVTLPAGGDDRGPACRWWVGASRIRKISRSYVRYPSWDQL